MRVKPLVILSLLVIFLVSSCSIKKATQPQAQETKAYVFLIPQAFSPRVEGGSDMACFISPVQSVPIKGKISIYNRWGQLVWETENLNACWNGLDSKSNKPYPVGTYYVRIEQNGIEKLSGAITIVR